MASGELIPNTARSARARAGTARAAQSHAATSLTDAHSGRLKRRSAARSSQRAISDAALRVTGARAARTVAPPLGAARAGRSAAPWQQPAPDDGGMSSVGLRSKKPTGSRRKPAFVIGMIGQSSGRTKWVTPIVYQSTTSSPSSGRSVLHTGSPSGSARP